MSNPIVTIGNAITAPSDPTVVRKTFSRVVFEQESFFVYAEGEFDPTYTTFDPTDKGERFFIFVPLDDALSSTVPDFMTTASWDETVKKAASGFVNGVNSIMPKLLIPSKLLVDNGLDTLKEVFFALSPDLTKELFNWVLDTHNGASILVDEFFDHAQVGAFFGSQYISGKAKSDGSESNNLVLSLSNPGTPPTGDWLAADGSDLVVGGAFMLMLNLVPLRAATSDTQNDQENPWSFKIEFGDVTMNINEVGAMKVNISGLEENTITVNLSDGKTKEGLPQQQHIDDKSPLIIIVYPVWNGIVVQSGVQDGREVVGVSTSFIPKLKGPSILDAPYSTGFDPAAPDEVLVGVGSGPTSVLVDFGTTMTVTANNVRFELAYVPVFFSEQCWFDQFFVASDDISGVVDFTYFVHPVWTKNGTSTTLSPDPPTVKGTSFVGPVPDTSYNYIDWRMEQTAHNRFAGEIFAMILEVQEERTFPIKNGNGNFNVAFTGGTPGDPSPTSPWWKYIQSLSVTVSLDGSNGSISVDKYGFAGQDAVTTQSIGAITITASGGEGTVSGSIFEGFALGIGDNESADGATWEIPLIGQEMKLDDIALINVPFFDGEPLDDAIDFLARYAGIIDDQSNAPTASSINLSVSSDIEVARFDWKSGTSVRTALDDVMDDTLHNYVVRDGKIFFYRLDSTTGLPTSLGTDFGPLYPDTKVVTRDQNPDFDDLRNEIVVIGLQADTGGKGTEITGIPLFPRVETRSTITVPDVPWAKSIVKPLPGVLTQAEISDIADIQQSLSSIYELIGRTQIPGNANIRPYDRFGGFVIYSVTHNLDFQSKSWTTDLEFMRDT